MAATVGDPAASNFDHEGYGPFRIDSKGGQNPRDQHDWAWRRGLAGWFGSETCSWWFAVRQGTAELGVALRSLAELMQPLVRGTDPGKVRSELTTRYREQIIR